MKKNKKLLKGSLYFIIIFICYVFIMSIFNYFVLITGFAFKIINFISISTIMFTSCFYIGTNSKTHGYKEGLIMGIINMSILFLISIILRSEINASFLLYILILLLSSTIGGMAGINFNTKK